MDAQQPIAPSAGVPLRAGNFTVERDVLTLVREVRAIASQLDIRDRDVCALTAVIHDGARRLRAAGAAGQLELSIGSGPSLQACFRVVAPQLVVDSLPSTTIEPLRETLENLTVTSSAEGASICAAVSVSTAAASRLPAVPVLLTNAADGPLAPASLLAPGGGDVRVNEPGDSGPDLESLFRSELEEANRAVVNLSAEIAEGQARLEAALAQATTLQKRFEGRVGDVAAANRAIEDFLSMLSHELRTPLNAILGWTRLLRLGSLDRAGTTRALDALERNAFAQAQLVGDILDASRIVTGQLQLDVRPVGIAALLDTAIEFVTPQADAKRLTIETEIRFQGQLSGDADRLRQVLISLLSNAVKFTSSGGRIRVSLVPSAGKVTLTISDTGQGIDQAFLPFVFERFRQGDTSVTRLHGGLGLGLSIVRHIVELHGGSVEVASDGPGRGASFSVHLPASPA